MAALQKSVEFYKKYIGRFWSAIKKTEMTLYGELYNENAEKILYGWIWV